MKIIDETDYINSIKQFSEQLKLINQQEKFDAVVAPKRSGLFPGVCVSHKLHIPMFLPAELRNRNFQFQKILAVDTAVFKGKTLRKLKNQLAPRKVFMAAMYQEGDSDCDYILYPENKGIVKFFYEVNNVSTLQY